MKYWEKKLVPTYVLGKSLIGVHGKPPHAWANYCWIGEKGGERENSYRALNMWAENITAAVEQFKLGDTMEALVYQRAAVVIDHRIPLDWRYDKLCFTGGSGIDSDDPVGVYGEVYEYLGDKDNEVEQFSNPRIYFARRGRVFKPSTYTVNGKEYNSGSIWMGQDATIEAKKILEEYENANT